MFVLQHPSDTRDKTEWVGDFGRVIGTMRVKFILSNGVKEIYKHVGELGLGINNLAILAKPSWSD